MVFVERFFLPLSALLLTGMAVVQVSSIREESQTFDEAMHLAAGYSYWKLGDFRMNPEHPPLGKLLNSLPLLWMDLRLPNEYPSWSDRNQLRFGVEFLYNNKAPADVMLFRARLVTIIATLALGAVLAWWTRLRFGAGTALVALAFYVFDPNFIAHGRYVTSDVFISLFSFLACAFAAEYFITQRPRYLYLTGVTTGLAFVTKFSALFLFVALPVLWYINRKRVHSPDRRTVFREAVIVAGLAAVVIGAIYFPDLKRLLPTEENAKVKRMAESIPNTSAIERLSATLSEKLNLPELALPWGLGRLIRHHYRGHSAYIMGQVFDKGRWYYFPIAFAVKAPTALLLTLCLAIGFLFRWAPRPMPVEYLALLVPVGVYFLISVFSSLNIGVRHLMPTFPFLFVLVAIALTRLPCGGRKVVMGCLLVLLAAESLAIYPTYLPFFNWISGGPANGRRWLVDSNLDWGQDLIRLKRYLDRNDIRDLALFYFGTAPPEYYGIRSSPAPRTAEVGNPPKFDGVVAVSVTPLQGIWVAPDDFAWLRNREPTARIGYSIHVYDFRENKESFQATK